MCESWTQLWPGNHLLHLGISWVNQETVGTSMQRRVALWDQKLKYLMGQNIWNIWNIWNIVERWRHHHKSSSNDIKGHGFQFAMLKGGTREVAPLYFLEVDLFPHLSGVVRFCDSLPGSSRARNAFKCHGGDHSKFAVISTSPFSGGKLEGNSSAGTCPLWLKKKVCH